jgi:hypothetical protein
MGGRAGAAHRLRPAVCENRLREAEGNQIRNVPRASFSQCVAADPGAPAAEGPLALRPAGHPDAARRSSRGRARWACLRPEVSPGTVAVCGLTNPESARATQGKNAWSPITAWP